MTAMAPPTSMTVATVMRSVVLRTTITARCNDRSAVRPGMTARIRVGLRGRGAVAETGSLVLDARDGRRVQLLPPTHVVLVRTRDVRATLAEALDEVARDQPSAVGLHSGPSKSADIGAAGFCAGAHCEYQFRRPPGPAARFGRPAIRAKIPGVSCLRAHQARQHSFHPRAGAPLERLGRHGERLPSRLCCHALRRRKRRVPFFGNPIRKAFRSHAGAGSRDAGLSGFLPSSGRRDGPVLPQMPTGDAHPRSAGRCGGSRLVD